MTWAPLLLANPSPSLRILVLVDLLNSSEDDGEVQELKKLQEEDPLILKLLALQNEYGAWSGDERWGAILGSIRLTAQALMGLGYLGLGPEHSAVKRGAEFIFSHQQNNGSWLLETKGALLDGGRISDDVKYHMIPLQTALPLLGLAWAGYATDQRAEQAYDWLLEEQLPQGGWPSGRHYDKYIFAAGYRRLAHSKFGCRTNTTAAVNALALHPKRRMHRAARRGLDLLLAHEHRQAHTLGFEIARIIGAERPRGGFTYFKRYDVAQMLDLSWRVGASLEDDRVKDNVRFVKELQGPYGLWEYQRHPEISQWVTFDLLRSLSRLDEETDWLSKEPRTPFQPYPKKPQRF
ncbi:MAG: terpene cyclase/mutase family protein [Candidatus Bathyarchaeota archaeon]|nr:MAG: terpene cyclase/mutase family protein [Candidatus Bathyarchaeota archaeon]